MGCCSNLEKCGFVAKHGEAKTLAVKGFITMYCKGDKREECRRKLFKEQNGYPPADDMMPNGMLMTRTV